MQLSGAPSGAPPRPALHTIIPAQPLAAMKVTCVGVCCRCSMRSRWPAVCGLLLFAFTVTATVDHGPVPPSHEDMTNPRPPQPADQNDPAAPRPDDQNDSAPPRPADEGTVTADLGTTTLDPFDEFCQDACVQGISGKVCDCPEHPIG